jgi:cation diffusion facilitator family transporter
MYKALIITLCGNIVLALIKSLAARLSGSSALSADAYNSISDVLYSIMLVIGLLIAVRPADISHPQGHRRFEPLVGMVVSFSMAWAGYRAVSGSIDKIIDGPEPFEFGLPVLILICSAVIKAVMYWSINRIARQIQSPTLQTASVDNLMDTITSFTAIIGIIAAQFINPLADPIAGILVSVWIFRAAFNALIENLNFLTGAGATETQREDFQQIIASVPGVLNVHQIFSEYVGTKLLLDVHINVDGGTTLYEVHQIESEIESRLTEIPDVERAYIHIEPPEYD